MSFLTVDELKTFKKIAGGDFNQIFSGGLEAYPNTHPENWLPGELTEDMLPEVKPAETEEDPFDSIFKIFNTK